MGRLAVLACQAASLAAVVLAWHVAVRTGVADPLFVPAPGAVAAAL
jgi:ABC-type nitrate/sulfonate/bicarbonate transport system permease component